MDDFVHGLVRARDGYIEKVTTADVDGDKVAELIVTIRSAGSGGYLSAHAFALGKKRVTLRGRVADLGKEADVVAALRKDVL